MSAEATMLVLTPEQRQEVREAGDAPLRLADPETHAEYIVLKLELYERMRRVFEEVDPSLYEFDEITPPTS
jgi:hypothetical protein